MGLLPNIPTTMVYRIAGNFRMVEIFVFFVSSVCIQKLKLRKFNLQETKTFTMLGEVGMANESTKTTQTSVRMAQHNE